MLFSKEEESSIIQAIQAAERMTSGEIRLYVEDFCLPDHPLERAAELFTLFGMHNTRERNGVLLYLAWKSRHFAIWGDAGIHEKVGFDFWEDEKQLLRAYLHRDEACAGICAVVRQIGEQMQQYFPASETDNDNELSDEIIYG